MSTPSRAPSGGASSGRKHEAPKGRPQKSGKTGSTSAPQGGATSGGGLTAAQRANPLTVVITTENYPNELLTQEQFSNFRLAFRQLTKTMPPKDLPKMETSFCRGGVFIFVASDNATKEWLLTQATTVMGEGPKLVAGGVELIQKMVKATVWLPGPPEEPTEVLERLEAFNPTLRTSSWRAIKSTPKETGRQETNDKYVMVFQLPESQVRALAALDYKPWYDLGRVAFKVTRQEETGAKGETEAGK